MRIVAVLKEPIDQADRDPGTRRRRGRSGRAQVATLGLDVDRRPLYNHVAAMPVAHRHELQPSMRSELSLYPQGAVMAEVLTESTWTGFTKKLKVDLDDATLTKALAKFDKAPQAKPHLRQEALRTVVDEIKKQVTALGKRKKELGDKAFGEVKDKLYALLDAAETLQKEVQRSVDAGGDDEEESPALLTTKLIPLIREVRKGDLVLQSLVAVAGKETVLLLSRKAISPARGKLLKEQMANPAGLKFVRGDCRFEQNALTFVVQAPAAQLARKIKEALLSQTGLRLKVRVRGEGGDLEEDGETEELADDGVPKAPPLPGAKVGQAPAAGAPTTQPQDTQADVAAAAFNARLAALVPTAKAAGPEVRAKVSEAGLAARKRSFDDANRLLDEAERMVEAGPSTDAKTASAAPGAGQAAPDDVMVRWKAQRTAAITTLKSVATKIASAKHAKSAKAILEIQAVIKNLTAEPSTQQQVTELQNYLGSDDVVNDVCEMVEDIRTPLLGVLTDLRAQVA
jgi:hypothetical protein